MATTNRAKILQTALNLFSARGYDAVGVQTIGTDARKIDFLARFKPDSYDKVIAKYLSGNGFS